jgi:predicted HD superfamily hydrolase involved in NAD metabolism
MSKKTDFTTLEEFVSSRVSNNRFLHCVSVGKTAMFFNQRFNAGFRDEDCYRAGLLHDVARNWTFDQMLLYCNKNNIHMEKEEIVNPVLLHAPVGANIVKKKGYESYELAIRWHTLGSKDMGKLGLIIYLSDYLEPRRSFLSDKDRVKFNKMDSMEEICINILDNEVKHRNLKNQSLAKSTEGLYNFLKEGGTF